MFKVVLIVFGLCVVTAIGLFLLLQSRSRNVAHPADMANASIYDGLRMQALKAARSDFGLQATAPDSPVWGVLMETGFPEGCATLVSIADGSASLYFSGGGGIIGGGEHENVRSAAIEFVKLANQHHSAMSPTKTFPVPGNGRTAFYLLTDDGVLTAETNEDDLGEQRHQLSPLFFAGHEVIGQLRMASDSQTR